MQFISGSSHITEIGPCVVSLQPNVPNQYFKLRFSSFNCLKPKLAGSTQQHVTHNRICFDLKRDNPSTEWILLLNFKVREVSFHFTGGVTQHARK